VPLWELVCESLGELIGAPLGGIDFALPLGATKPFINSTEFNASAGFGSAVRDILRSPQ
jgi:hypothetical protein